MSSIRQSDYLRLCQATAKTNSPNDQPIITQMSDFMTFLSKLPSKDNIQQLDVEKYEELLNFVEKEIEIFQNPVLDHD
ncbi:hypothetical protein M9Y10_013688 [Tritrichomonas musculus]|uniref:Uncharacterized protein n=1 Tax=Tritrichomonas musculus TaxID=1915356 RepID=A0ABR2KY78_9EUKA